LDWKKTFGFSVGDVFGLDIGSSSVKLVQLRRSEEGYTAAAAGKIEIGAGGGDRDVETSRTITDCCDMAQVVSEYAVCSVCGPEVAVRPFSFPVMPSEEIASAIALEAEQVSPFNMDVSVLDYQLIPDASDSIKGLLVAATDKIIKQKEKLVKDASLRPIIMDVDGLALLNSLFECQGCESDRAMAVLNVGNTYSTLAIAGQDSVPFIRDTNCAGSEIIKLMLEQTGLAHKQITDNLFGDDNKDDEMNLNSSLADACKKLVNDITGTLRYYDAQKESLPIDKLYVCGGFARAKGFVEILDAYFPVHVVLWNPFDKISCVDGYPGKEIMQNEGPSFAVAAGLAMRLL